MNSRFFKESIRKLNGEDLFHYENIEPDDKAVIFIVHGLADHAARYEKLAVYLRSRGFGTAALDLPGHGKSAGIERIGIWPDNGFDECVEAIKTGVLSVKTKYNKPVILFGHSMGSFLSLGFLSKYGDLISGSILSGTNDRQLPVLLSVGKIIAYLQCVFLGKDKKSNLLDSMSFGGFNKSFKPNRTEFDWLSRDNEEVDRYVSDPFCGFVSSPGLFKSFLKGLSVIYSDESLEKISADLPIYIFCGSKDPVGGFGTGPKKLKARLEKIGIKRISIKVYEEARHECHNEINGGEVVKDVAEFCESIL